MYGDSGWKDKLTQYKGQTITYDESGSAYAIKWDGSKYYFVKNLQGDVLHILDNMGNVVVSYEYDAWGKVSSVTGSMADTLGQINPIRYRSYYYDNETGFYYLNSRYYDPEIKRYINADTTDLLAASPEISHWDKNLFAYCDNNPVIRADSSGEIWHIVIGAVVGGLVNGAIKAVSNLIEGKKVTDGLGTAILSGAASGALASTGVGIGVMIIGNASISMAENAANQIIANKGFENFDAVSVMIDGVAGGISGAIGGAGTGSKHLTNLGKQTVKRSVKTTVHKGIKAGIRGTKKAFVYYSKNTVKYFGAFRRNLLPDIARSSAISLADLHAQAFYESLIRNRRS